MAIQRKARVNPTDSIMNDVISAVGKKYQISKLDDSSEFAQVNQFVSFGHYGLDNITGGGAPAGRLLELYGAFSSGKSLLIAHLLSECQRAGGIAVLDDCEHAYNKHFGQLIGIDNDRLLYSASTSVEEVFEKMEAVLTTILAKNPDQLVVYAWDSVAAVSCLAELKAEVIDTGGFHTEKAIAITRGTRKVVGLIGKHNVCLVVANQMKKAVGVMYGPQETTPGGDAIPFWASVRIKLGKGDKVREGDKDSGDVIGVRCRAEATKNKIVKPFQKCEFTIMFDQGLVYSSGCIDALIAKGIITPLLTEEKVGKGGQIQAARNSGYYSLQGSDRKWRKKELEDYFEDNREALASLLGVDDE